MQGKQHEYVCVSTICFNKAYVKLRCREKNFPLFLLLSCDGLIIQLVIHQMDVQVGPQILYHIFTHD